MPATRIFLGTSGLNALVALLVFVPSLPAAENATPSTSPAAASDPLASLPESQRATFARLLELHNYYRARSGKAPLHLSPTLCTAGQGFAEYMQSTGRFSHTADGRSPGDRIAAAGYRSSAWSENIAYGSTSADDAVKMWVNSSGHYANMLGGCTEVGFGQSGTMWVAVFATPAQ